jgi:hypothetical protein
VVSPGRGRAGDDPTGDRPRGRPGGDHSAGDPSGRDRAGAAGDDRTGDRLRDGPGGDRSAGDSPGDDHSGAAGGDHSAGDSPGDDHSGAAGGDRTGDRVEPGAGRAPICRLATWATGVFVVVSVLAAAWPDTFLPLSVPVDLVLFATGCGAFLWAYALAIGRSRYETIAMGGLFFLGEGVAPPDVTRLLRGALGVQVVVAVTAAAVRPFTALAFSVLVPMLGLGLMTLWAARHGRFPAKPSEDDD